VNETIGMGQTGQLAPDYKKATRAANDIFQLLDEKSEIDPLTEEGESPLLPHGDVDFNKVHFTYPTRAGHRIFEGIDLKIPAHKSVALVGGSGSGKSTTIALIQRLYDPAIFQGWDTNDKKKPLWDRSATAGIISPITNTILPLQYDMIWYGMVMMNRWCICR
jgi:ABC-type multidrug transport system fused ATPase/permease subunit